MSPFQTLISVEEYLHTSYRPDCDYVDGQVLERNMGEKPHARLQGFFIAFLRPFEDQFRFEVLPEQRLQTRPKRYRIPDVMLAAVPNEEPLIVRTAPLLCIEILSSEDSIRSIRERIAEYAQMGVPTSWSVDPWRRIAYTAGPDGMMHEANDSLHLPGTSISITVDALFAELDRLRTRAMSPNAST